MDQTNQTEDVDKISIEVLIPYVGLNVFGVLSGTIGNLMIIGAVLLTKKLQNATGLIILNLALSDLFVSAFSNAMAVIGALVGRSFFDQIPLLCKLTAIICRITCATAFVNIVLLAAVRYIYVCFKNIYNKYFSLNNTILACSITWIIGFFSDFPNQLVLNGHHFDEIVLTCIFDHKIIRPATYFFSIALMVLPAFCICFLYMNIFMVTLNAKFNLHDKKKLKQLKKSLRVSKGLFLAFLIFTICVLPYAIVMMTDFESKFPRWVHMFLFLLARLNSSLNPILYGFTNTLFMSGFKNLYRKMCFSTFLESNLNHFD